MTMIFDFLIIIQPCHSRRIDWVEVLFSTGIEFRRGWWMAGMLGRRIQYESQSESGVRRMGIACLLANLLYTARLHLGWEALLFFFFQKIEMEIESVFRLFIGY
jgi:hypothetical protein